MPISVTSASMSACGERNAVPVPAASRGYAFGSVQSVLMTLAATRGMPASAMASDTSRCPAVIWSLSVAWTPASMNWREHSMAPSMVAPSSQVVTSMQAPLAPPRALNASAEASRAEGLVAQGDDRRLERGHQAEVQGLEGLVARAVVPQADGRVVDVGGGLVAGTAVVTAAVVAARTGHERERQHRRERTPKGPRHPTLPPGPTRRANSMFQIVHSA